MGLEFGKAPRAVGFPWKAEVEVLEGVLRVRGPGGRWGAPALDFPEALAMALWRWGVDRAWESPIQSTLRTHPWRRFPPFL